MLSVEEAASSLTSGFLATVRAGGEFNVAVARLKLGLDAAALHDEARSVLKEFVRLLRRDASLLVFVEALEHFNVKSLGDVAKNAGPISEFAEKLAGFDVVAELRSLAGNAPGARLPGELVEPARLRPIFVESIGAKLRIVPLQDFLRVAAMVGEAELGHEIHIAFDRLEAAVRRLDTGWDERLREAGHLFVAGKLETPEVARLLAISPSDVAAEFERLGFIRSASTIRLTEAERGERLAAMASQRGTPFPPDLRRREVIASQRIEGIEARPHLDTPADPIN